jgi:VWFA-related protein
MFLAAFVVAASLLAQESAPPLFIDQVDVNVLNVEVFVTDKEGRFVSGLTVEDFQVFEDGRPVKLTNFYAVAKLDEGAKSAATAGDTDPEVKTQEINPEDAAEKSEDQKLHFLVYLDNFNIRHSNRKRVMERLQSFLEERLEGGDEVMLMTHNPGLRVEEPLTADRERILAGFERIRDTLTRGQDAATRQALAARNIQSALSDPNTADSAPGFLRSFIDEERSNLQRSTKALKTAVRSLAGVEGRKALLYVSDGLPLRPGARLADQFFGLVNIEDESSLFEAVTREANAHEITFYSLDARGATGVSSVSSAVSSAAGGGNNRAGFDALATMNYQESLIEMSLPTGGTALLNTSSIEEALERVAKDFDSYYSLGFEPTGAEDGSSHHIEVKVSRPGVEVRHRSVYTAKPEVEKVADRALGALLQEKVNNPLGVRVEFGQVQKKGRDKFQVTILVRVPIRSVTLLPNGDNVEGRLQFYVAVQDEQGDISAVHQEGYPIKVPAKQAEAAREQELGYSTALLMRGGTSKIVVGVWDEISREEAFVPRIVNLSNDKKKNKKERSSR